MENKSYGDGGKNLYMDSIMRKKCIHSFAIFKLLNERLCVCVDIEMQLANGKQT